MRIYYHNITKDQINEGCWVDFMEVYEDGDTCFKSESGNACLREITEEDFRELKERYNNYSVENE